MAVYPVAPQASAPKWIYDATKRTRRPARLVEGGNGVESSLMGIPFPIPTSGIEVIWNHLLRYRRRDGPAPVRPGRAHARGQYTLSSSRRTSSTSTA